MPGVGDLHWLVVQFRDGTGEKTRPAVVIMAGLGKVVVVPGTGTERPGRRHVVIRGESRVARACGLTKTTYFYVSDARWVAHDQLGDFMGRMPTDLAAQVLREWQAWRRTP